MQHHHSCDHAGSHKLSRTNPAQQSHSMGSFPRQACSACKQCFNKSGSSTPLRLMDSCWILGRVVLLGKLRQLASKASDGEKHCSIIIGASIQVYMDHLEKSSVHPKGPKNSSSLIMCIELKWMKWHLSSEFHCSPEPSRTFCIL